MIILAGRFLLYMVEVDRLVTCQLLGFDNLFQGRLNSHSMAPQGNLHVSGQGDVGPKMLLTCSSWGGRSNKALFVSQLVLTLAACA